MVAEVGMGEFRERRNDPAAEPGAFFAHGIGAQLREETSGRDAHGLRVALLWR